MLLSMSAAADRESRFAAGDVAAVESLCREYQAPVFAWIVRVVRDRGVAEELTIDAFWRMYNAHASFDPRRSFGAWARRIATNVAIDHFKRQRKTAPALHSASFTPPDPGITAELRDEIARAFARLPAKLRVTALLALVEEQPYAEIAAALDISVEAVKARVFRATRILRQHLTTKGLTP